MALSPAGARSSPRLGPASRAARQLGATPTRSAAGILPLSAPATAVGRFPGWMGEMNGFRSGCNAIRGAVGESCEGVLPISACSAFEDALVAAGWLAPVEVAVHPPATRAIAAERAMVHLCDVVTLGLLSI